MNWKERYDVDLIYDNPLQSENDIQGFRLEGEADLSFPSQRMRLGNQMDAREGQKSNFVFWCPENFPSDIVVTWDFWPIREPGLCMLFFSAMGIDGDDIFDPKLAHRTGMYDQYHHGDMNAYHVSYYRRRWEEERAFHTCNLRKSYGFHLVAQGADPIPDVADAQGPYRITLIKHGVEIIFMINDLTIFHWHDDKSFYGKSLGGGKIGFRQMAPFIAEYANLKVYGINGMVQTKPVTVYLAGDSTVQTYEADSAPQAGWGQFIGSYYTEDIQFINHAIGGRSSKTFVEEGRLDAILEEISANDYLMIQMGHNDSTKSRPERYTDPYTTYKQYLRMYIHGARRHHAIPILITPMARLHYKDDVFVNDFPDYCNAMKQVAAEESVELIDLMTRSLTYYSSIGYDEASTLFMISSNGTDCTHFTEKGAIEIAKLLVQAMAEQNFLSI